MKHYISSNNPLRPQFAARSSYQAPRSTARAMPQVAGNTALAHDDWEEF